MYLPKLKKALNDKKGSFETPPDPTEVILQIDIVLKELPEPGPTIPRKLRVPL